MRTGPPLACACFLAVLDIAGAAANAVAAGRGSPPARIEARSADFLAVGLVHQDRMTIHVSRLIDNAPISGAAVTVVLRGAAHPTIAESDGSFTLQTQDLALPGTAGIEFEVTQGATRETLRGRLEPAGAASGPDVKNSTRQLWWWVLNFAVCIGFLWLYSRRRKSAQH